METSLSLLASKTVQSKPISIIIDLQQKIQKKKNTIYYNLILSCPWIFLLSIQIVL